MAACKSGQDYVTRRCAVRTSTGGVCGCRTGKKRENRSLQQAAEVAVLTDASPAGPPMASERITAGVSGGSRITIGNDSPRR